jgi:hypothetical protein
MDGHFVETGGIPDRINPPQVQIGRENLKLAAAVRHDAPHLYSRTISGGSQSIQHFMKEDPEKTPYQSSERMTK